jgi:hypothetical protein
MQQKNGGWKKYAKCYCRNVDYKILEGYNPDIKLNLDDLFF